MNGLDVKGGSIYFPSHIDEEVSSRCLLKLHWGEILRRQTPGREGWLGLGIKTRVYIFDASLFFSPIHM